MPEFPDQKRVTELWNKLAGESTNGNHANGRRGERRSSPSSSSDSPDVERIIEVFCKDPERREIFHGGNAGYPSASEADGRFFFNLAYYCGGDLNLMKEVANRSGRRRPKWDAGRSGTTWLEQELTKAAGRVTDKWEPTSKARAPGGEERDESKPQGDTSNPLLAGLVDLGAAVEHGIEPPEELEPGILLKGMVTHIFAPAAVGKTFKALWLAVRAAARGETVLYIDEENGPYIISERLQMMGVDTGVIREHFHYLPSPSLSTRPEDVANYRELVNTLKPDLVIFDSLIKFLSSAGFAENENDDITKWATAFLKPLRDRGVTTVVLDHVPHDGNRSRGASRKIDEVDVQYSLVKTQHFGRGTVGEIKLNLVKDRLGWLPQSTTFSIGGGEEGFVFSRSSGTVDEPGTAVLKSSEKGALDILKERFGVNGARYNRWRDACVPRRMADGTFKRAVRELIRGHLVRKEETPNGPTYFPTDGDGGPEGNGPENSPYISLIPDRGHEGPFRGHGPDGGDEGPEGPHPYRGGPVAPPHGPTPENGPIEDELADFDRRLLDD